MGYSFEGVSIAQRQSGIHTPETRQMGLYTDKEGCLADGDWASEESAEGMIAP
jgi:hypothetical protein